MAWLVLFVVPVEVMIDPSLSVVLNLVAQLILLVFVVLRKPVWSVVLYLLALLLMKELELVLLVLLAVLPFFTFTLVVIRPNAAP